MPRNIITALDVGTSTVQVMVAEMGKKETKPQILGLGEAVSRGMRRGLVVDLADVAACIREALEAAQKSAGIPIKSVWLALEGVPISITSSRGVIAVSRADGEISPEDVRRALLAASNFIPKNPNKETLHIIPRDFRVDEERGVRNPAGMHGVRLEVDTLVVEHASLPLKNLLKCVESAGVRIEEYIFGPLAASQAVLTKRQRELGTVLVDFGGGTSSFMVWEEGVPIHAGVIPLGGDHISNDIAVGLRTHIDIAEKVKLVYGSCLSREVSKRQDLHISEFIGDVAALNPIKPQGGAYSRRELAEIIEARLRDIFELLRKELKKINRAELLPGGTVWVGGSAFIPGLTEFAREELRLPAEIGYPQESREVLGDDRAPAWAAVSGIIKWAADSSENSLGFWGERFSRPASHSWIRWLRSLLP